MREFLDYLKNEANTLLRDKKKLINLLILGLLILGMPLSLYLIGQKKIISSRAASDPIVFTGPNVRQKPDKTWVTTNPQIQIQLNSPLGGPTASIAGGGQ